MLKTLIIGCGNIAGGYDMSATRQGLTHMGAYRQDGRFNVTACVDPDAGARDAFQRAWNIPQGYDDLDGAMRAEGSFDVVSLCSPSPLHAAHLRQIITHSPRAIFCEKPLTGDVDLSRQLIDACARRGILLCVNHLRRWDNVLADHIAELGRGERFGKIRSVTALYNKGLMNNGSHMADLLLWLFDDLVVVDAPFSTADYSVSDPTVSAILRSSDGTPIFLTPGNAGDFSVFELQFVCERGVVSFEDGCRKIRVRSCIPDPDFAGYTGLDGGETFQSGLNAALRNAVANIYDAVQGHGVLASTGESALRAEMLCRAIHLKNAENHRGSA